MLSPKYQRYADRLRELVAEGEAVALLPRPSSIGSYIQDKDMITAQAWLTKVHNIIELLFGPESPQCQKLNSLTKNQVAHAYEVYPIVGLVSGALDDVEKGYLAGYEFIVAAEVFDSVLEQAKHLNHSGHKDPAAVLARVVLEDSLKRIAREEGIDDTQNASRLNDDLRKAGKYPQPQWRLVQSWLDLGNAAAHGKFSEYNQDDIERLIEDVERFLATELRT